MTLIPNRLAICLLLLPSTSRLNVGASGCPPSSAETLRDPDNFRKQLRTAVEGTDWAGLHPHAFRHFVSTRLDAAGWTARKIADYLGHDRISTTQDEYMDRHVAGEGSTDAMPMIKLENDE